MKLIERKFKTDKLSISSDTEQVIMQFIITRGDDGH